MKNFIISVAAVIAICVVAAPSHAASSAAAGSQAAAGSRSGAAALAGGGRAGAAQGQSMTYAPNTFSKGSDMGRMAPNIAIGGFGGGANSCAVGANGGITTGGFGILGGRQWSDPNCEARLSLNNLYPMMNMQDSKSQHILKGVMCGSDVYRDALEYAAMSSGDSSLKCIDKRTGTFAAPVKPKYKARTVSTASTRSYSTEVAKCRSVSDTRYAGCMKTARKYR